MTVQIVNTGIPNPATAASTFPKTFFTQTSTFEGTPYLLSFQYNQRLDCWFMSIADSQAVDIYNGVKIVTGVSLLKKCADSRKPAGALLCKSATNDESPPGLNDLVEGSGRCTLFYITSDWVQLLNDGELDVILQQLATNTQGGTQSTYGQLTQS